MPEISEARMKELADNWNEETSDPETQEWRDDLTPAETKIIDDWDQVLNVGMCRMRREIMRLQQEARRNA